MKKSISFFLLLIIGATVVFTQESKLVVNRQKVTIEEIKKDLYRSYIAVTGTVEPMQTIYLVSLENEAVVENIEAETGSMIQKGDLIITLSNQDLALEILSLESQIYGLSNELEKSRLLQRQQLLRSESQILEIQAGILQQERAFRRNKELQEKGNISQEQYDNSKLQYELSQKQIIILEEIMKNDSLMQILQLESLERSLKMMMENLAMLNDRDKQLQFRAPESGEVYFYDLQVGEVLKKGERIGQINIHDSYKLRVDIDEYFISDVLKGLFGEANFGGSQYRVNISKIYPEVSKGRFTVDMDFVEKAPEQLKIGQSCRIKLELGNPREAILIPRGGYYQSTGGQWVYVLDSSGDYAEKRSITLGSQNPRYYEVLEGLQPGEKVIISNYDTFGDVDKLIFK